MSSTVFQENMSEMQRDIRDMIPRLWGVNRWTRNDAPCNHPCSLMKADIDTLFKKKYKVGAKADGTRAFMLFSFTPNPEKDYTALVNRRFESREMRISAPSEYYSGTLLDGEIVQAPDGSEEYLVFDIIAMCGYSMVKKTHSERYGEVIRVVNSIKSPVLRVRPKTWFEFGDVGYKEVVQSIEPHKSDGLIFVPESGSPLSVGRQTDHYKWKRADDHTIDFLLEGGTLWLERHGVREVAPYEVVGHEGLHGVVECSMKWGEHGWVATVVRTRPDKSHPNDTRIARLTLQNIEENVVVTDLMKE